MMVNSTMGLSSEQVADFSASKSIVYSGVRGSYTETSVNRHFIELLEKYEQVYFEF